MTLDEAAKIVDEYGKHLEYMIGKLMCVFTTNIPESFLPYPVNTIEEAVNSMGKHYHELGREQAVKELQAALFNLNYYVNDEEALIKAATYFNNKGWRDAYLPSFKEYQKEWIDRNK